MSAPDPKFVANNVMELLIGAKEFWVRAREDIQSARSRVLVQAMTFEGDAVGLQVAETVLATAANDRRVLVDDYTRVNINDMNVASAAARRNLALQSEVYATTRMFKTLISNGVRVRVTNPIGRLGLNYPCRNHKKLIVADGIAYVGGVNFSDHNFGWLDLMLRIDDRGAADFLAADFDKTFCGRAELASFVESGLHLVALNGRANARGFADVFSHISSSRHEIVVVSPYLTAPFTDALGAARRRGVAVRILTPWPSNKPIVRNALLWAASHHGFEVILNPVMSHLKGMMIDGRHLILGSSNFDFVSLAVEEEILAIVDDPTIIREFESRVVSPATARALTVTGTTAALKGVCADIALRAAASALPATEIFPRGAVDWPSPEWNSRHIYHPGV